MTLTESLPKQLLPCQSEGTSRYRRLCTARVRRPWNPGEQTILAQSKPFTASRVGGGRGTPTRASIQEDKGSVAGNAGPMDAVGGG